MSKFKLGTRYVSRGGEEIRIYATDGEGSCPIHGAIKRKGEWCCRVWTSNGRECESNYDSRNDIVGEWVDPLRAKAEAIASNLMIYRLGGRERSAVRLGLFDECGFDVAGWSFINLSNCIHKHLLELEEERQS